MSGFEIAGVVLGTVPIVVSALQFYLNGVNTVQKWSFYSREVKTLIRNLETAQVGLLNACEMLLVGIAPQSQIEEMINDPFGPLWQDADISSRVRRRLWRSSKVFEETVNDMKDAIEKMKSKLNISSDGEVSYP